MKLKDLPEGAQFRDHKGRVWTKGFEIRPDPMHSPGGQPVFAAGGFLCNPEGNTAGTSGMDIWYPDAEVEPAS